MMIPNFHLEGKMIFNFFKKKTEVNETQEIVSVIAETADERCIKITQTLISLSRLRAVEHPPEESVEH